MTTFGKEIRRWFGSILKRDELQDFDAHEMGQMARDVGCSSAELRELDRRGPNAASRLPRRLQVLGISSEVLEAEHPAEYRDMQRRCALCDHHGRCGRDLSRDPSGRNWQSYCPNAKSIISYEAASTPAPSEATTSRPFRIAV